MLGLSLQLDCRAARQFGGYIRRRFPLSSSLNGKYFSTSEATRSGRQGAGRPHMSIVGSSLWGSPIACPNSCAMTLRATFGNVSGHKRSFLIATSALSPRRAANEMKSPSDKATMMSPVIRLALSGNSRAGSPVPLVESILRSSTGITPRTSVKPPNRNLVAS